MAGKLPRIFCFLMLLMPMLGYSQQQVELVQLIKLLLTDGEAELTLSQMQISIADSKLKRNKGIFNYISDNYPQSIENQGNIAY